jgi:hypothetical protein
MGALAAGGAIAAKMAKPFAEKVGKSAVGRFGANTVKKAMGAGAMAIGAGRQAKKEGGKAGHVAGAVVHSLANTGAQALKEQMKNLGSAFMNEKPKPKPQDNQTIGEYLEAHYAAGKSQGTEYMERRNNTNGVSS